MARLTCSVSCEEREEEDSGSVPGTCHALSFVRALKKYLQAPKQGHVTDTRNGQVVTGMRVY